MLEFSCEMHHRIQFFFALFFLCGGLKCLLKDKVFHFDVSAVEG